ncbi:MAG: response regulator [Candidatus Bipolaricaulota bacterium]
MDSATPALVLVVEDDAPVRRFLRTALVAHGYRVLEAETAAGALAAVTTAQPDVVLLDLALPDRDGMDVAREIREWSRVPILVISARGREADKVRALDAGADDYLTKPFGTNELLARIRVALRHAAAVGSPPTSPILEVGFLRIDQDTREVTADRRSLHLTPMEYRLLVVMAKNAGRVLTHHFILKEVWGGTQLADRHALRMLMLQLRRKVEPNPARPQLLTTELGVGYRLREP